jgi:hypothetical protein
VILKRVDAQLLVHELPRAIESGCTRPDAPVTQGAQTRWSRRFYSHAQSTGCTDRKDESRFTGQGALRTIRVLPMGP